MDTTNLDNTSKLLLELLKFDVANSATPKSSIRQLKELLREQDFDDEFVENINTDTLKGFNAAITIAKRIIGENNKELLKKTINEIKPKVAAPIYECYEKREGGFNLQTCFYSKEQVEEFAATAGKRILSASAIKEMCDKINETGKYSFIWDLQYKDIILIPEKYLPPKQDITEEFLSGNKCSIFQIRECMEKYLDTNPCVYEWLELGVGRFGELIYLHMDGSGDKLRGITGSDGYPDILNDRGESVFDYMEEMGLTQKDVDEIRGISKENRDLL